MLRQISSNPFDWQSQKLLAELEIEKENYAQVESLLAVAELNYFEKSEIKLLPQVFYKNDHTQFLRAYCLIKSNRFVEAKAILAKIDCFEYDHVIAALFLHCLMHEGRMFDIRMLMNVIPRGKSLNAMLQIKAFSKMRSNLHNQDRSKLWKEM